MKTQLTEEVLNIFQQFRMAPTSLDEYETKGRALLSERISPMINAAQPLSFYMLGFPMKSMNTRDKVLGELPDLGEEVALKNFGVFNDAVKKVYQPGIVMNIINDGYVFNDLMDIWDNTVRKYEEVTLDMSKDMPIRIYDLRDFYNGGGRLNEMRDKLIEQFGISEAELETRILTDPNVNFLYRGMIRFMTEDIAIKDWSSGNQHHKAAKKLARAMMLRNEAYSALAKKEFGGTGSIRLSMHPSTNNGDKYSFQLIPGSPDKVWTSPWHCAILVDDSGYATIHKADALKAGMHIVEKDGRPYFFEPAS